MEFVAAKKDFAQALAKAQGIPETKNMSSVMANVLLESVDSGTVRLTAQSYEVTLVVSFPAQVVTTRLQDIGDISCDIDGSIEITRKATKPDAAYYTYFAENDRFEDGVPPLGVTVMAVDNLPCEFPRESSQEFSRVLRDFVPQIVAADFSAGPEDLKLPYPMQKALVLHRGSFGRDYQYMNDYIK